MSLKLEIYDSSLLRLGEGQILSSFSNQEDLDVLHYLHGRCHIFALAAVRALGPEAKYNAIIDFESCEDGPQLMHAYASYKDLMIDARGIIELEDLADYEANSSGEYDYFELNESEVMQNMKQGIWGQANDSEIEQLMDFIKKHIDLYTQTDKYKLKAFIDKHADPIAFHDLYEDLDIGFSVEMQNNPAIQEVAELTI